MVTTRSKTRAFKARLASVLGVLTVAVLFTPGVANVASAKDRDDWVNDQKQTEQKLTGIQADINETNQTLRDAYQQLQTTRDQIPAAEQALSAAESDLSAAQRKAETNAALLEAAQHQLDSIEAQVDASDERAVAAQNSLAELARATYRGVGVPTTVDLMVNSATAQDFMDAYAASSALQRSQTSALAEYEQTLGLARNRQERQAAVQERVKELKAEADQLLVETEEKRANAEAKRDDLSKLEADIERRSQELESHKAEAQAAFAAEEKKYQEIKAQIAKIDEENRRKAAQAAAQAQREAAANGSGGLFTHPLHHSAFITSPFGWRADPFTGARTYHAGVDFASPCGEVQYAAAPGTVSFAGWNVGNGIIINHGMMGGHSWVSMYWHASSVAVYAGQRVDQNTVIGYTGSTGYSTGCHLHFEVYRDGQLVDPMTLL